MNPPLPIPVSTRWELASSNQRPNSQTGLEEREDGFRKGVYPDRHDGDCRCVVAEEKEMMMSPIVSQRSDVELLQNCDLPPPLKVFTCEKETALTTAMSKQSSPPIKIGLSEEFSRGLIDDRLGLLKALQLSQTRAREAEKKASSVSIENDNLTAMFFEESSRLFAHRQWLRLLEIEILHLKAQLAVSDSHTTKKQSGEKKEGDEGSGWCIALAVCLGLAGLEEAMPRAFKPITIFHFATGIWAHGFPIGQVSWSTTWTVPSQKLFLLPFASIPCYHEHREYASFSGPNLWTWTHLFHKDVRQMPRSKADLKLLVSMKQRQ